MFIYIYIYILMFLEERDIKVEQITYLVIFLTDVDYRTLTELTLGG